MQFSCKQVRLWLFILESLLCLINCFNFSRPINLFLVVNVRRRRYLLQHCALHFAGHTEQKKCWDLLRQKFDWFQTIRNKYQASANKCQHCCSSLQMDATCWAQQCCVLLAKNVASVCIGLYFYQLCWHEARPNASLASRMLSQLPKCIHNSIDAQLKHGPFRLEHWYWRFIQNLSQNIHLSVCICWTQARDLIDARACVYQDFDARSRYAKSAGKIASNILTKLYGYRPVLNWTFYIAAFFHGQSIKVDSHRKDIATLLPATFVTATMTTSNPGTWMLNCIVTDHYTAGIY